MDNGFRVRYVPCVNLRKAKTGGLSDEEWKKVHWHLRNRKYTARTGISSGSLDMDGYHRRDDTYIIKLPDDTEYAVCRTIETGKRVKTEVGNKGFRQYSMTFNIA